MQVTSAPTQVSREGLIGDMFALASYLMRTSNVGAFNAIAELDLSFTQIKALCAMDLDANEPSVKGLAESMKVSLPAMSRAVDGLFERGFVDRYEDREDRRMKRIRLTDAGRTVTSTLNEARLIGMQDFLTSLSDEETDALGHALELILADRPELTALRPSPTEISQLPPSEKQPPPGKQSPPPPSSDTPPPPSPEKGAIP